MVKRIFVAEARGRPMKSVSSVDAITGQGLAGDRYCRESIRRGPDYQVSLIEAEAIDEFTKQLGLRMTEDMPRRNMQYDPINFQKKLSLFEEQWQPKVIAALNEAP